MLRHASIDFAIDAAITPPLPCQMPYMTLIIAYAYASMIAAYRRLPLLLLMPLCHYAILFSFRRATLIAPLFDDVAIFSLRH